MGAALGLLAAVPLHPAHGAAFEKLRVGAPPTFARQILVPALERYTTAHPEVELEIVLSIPTSTPPPPRPMSRCATAIRPRTARPCSTSRSCHGCASLLQRLGPLRTPVDLRNAPLLRHPLEPWAPWFAAAGLTCPEPAHGTRLVDLGMALEAAVMARDFGWRRPSPARYWLASGALRPLFGLARRPRPTLLPAAACGRRPAASFATGCAPSARRVKPRALCPDRR